VTRGIDPPEVEGYQWDGWKLIMIAKLNTNGTFHSRKWSCVWRPDIGSSLYARSDWMRAGGVGGVAWLQTGAVQSYSYGTGGAEVHVPLADHMGNVRHYYQFKASGSKVTGQLVASYEYDAFGREVRAWGLNTPATNQPPGLPASRLWADLLPFHYSSKLRDVDSGFNYYGYRFYDPGAGRWLNRDQGEEGAIIFMGSTTTCPQASWMYSGASLCRLTAVLGSPLAIPGKRLISTRYPMPLPTPNTHLKRTAVWI
jgi:RHS repeat-associated protein